MNYLQGCFSRHWFWLSIGFVLLFWSLFLGVAPLWLDEAGSYYYVSRGSLTELMNILKVDTGLPFYYIVLFFWAKLFGYSELGLRSLSYVFYLADIGLLYVLLRRMFNIQIARWSAVIMALSSYMLNQAADVRMYTVEVFLCLLAYLLVWSLASAQDKRWRWLLLLGLSVVNTLGLYTHYWYFIFCAVQFAVACWLVRRWWIAIPYALSGLGFWPWFTIMRHHLQYSQYSSNWLTAPGLMDIIETFSVFMATKRSLGFGLGVVLLGIMLFIYRRQFWQVLQEYRRPSILLALWLFGVISVGFILSQFKPVYYPIRYLIVAYPAFVGLLALLFSRIQLLWQKVLIVLVLFSTVLITYVIPRLYPGTLSDRVIAKELTALLSKETLLVYTGLSRPTLDYYLRQLNNPRLSFPLEQAAHPAWYSTDYYLRQPEVLRTEIAALRKQRSMCVIYDKDPVSDQLRAALGPAKKQFSVHGAYCQEVVLY